MKQLRTFKTEPYSRQILLRRIENEAFTLTELLVSITIISILAGLLLVASRNMLERGRRATCISNLHQISHATLMYADEHDGYVPALGTVTESLFPYLNIKDDTDISGMKHVFYCPSATGKPIVTAGSPTTQDVPDAKYGGAYTLSGGLQCYGYNVGLEPGFEDGYTWFPVGYPGVLRLSAVTSPSQVFWAMDGGSSWIYDLFPENVSVLRHGKTEDGGGIGFNAVFADGHAQWVPWSTYRDWYRQGFPQGDPYSWW